MSTAARTSSKKHTRVLKGSWESNFYKGESYFEQFILGISGASNVKGTFELRMYEVRAKRILCIGADSRLQVDEQDYGMADIRLHYRGKYNHGLLRDIRLTFAKSELETETRIVLRNQKFDVTQQFLFLLSETSGETKMTYSCVYPNDHGTLEIERDYTVEGFEGIC